MTAFVRDYLARRQTEGAFAGRRPEAIVHMVFSVVVQFGRGTARGAHPPGLTEDEIVEQVVSLVAALRRRS